MCDTHTCWHDPWEGRRGGHEYAFSTPSWVLGRYYLPTYGKRFRENKIIILCTHLHTKTDRRTPLKLQIASLQNIHTYMFVQVYELYKYTIVVHTYYYYYYYMPSPHVGLVYPHLPPTPRCVMLLALHHKYVGGQVLTCILYYYMRAHEY